MRHARILRLLMPMWHHKEKQIALQLRQNVLQLISDNIVDESAYKKLDRINGYREVRFKKFDEALSE